MKVTLISNLYKPYARGGAEIIVERTAKELKKQGHEVSIISARPWDGFSSLNPLQEEVDGIKVIRFYPLNIFFYANDYKYPFFIRAFWHVFDLFNFQSSNLIKDILANEKPDLVITHNLMGLGYFIPGVIKRSGVKHIHVLHDIQLAVRSGIMKKGQEQSWFVTGLPAKIYQKIVKSLFGSPDVVISPSKFLLEFYNKLGYFPESKKEVLRNPINKSFLAINGGESTSSVSIRFAYIGQLVEHKGLRTLRNAFKSIERKDIKLYIVGDGPLMKEMEEWANSDQRVIYSGRIANEKLPEFLNNIDAVILPTETYENSPTVVFESLATGTPVIVSNIGGAAEPIEEGKNGYTFEPGDVNQLSEKIKKMMDNHHLMEEASRRSVEGMEEMGYVKKLLSFN